jgi:DNA-binding MarR family transcriptional regulator
MSTLTNGATTPLPLSAMAGLVLDAPSTAFMDLETRTTVDDHQDLRLWLRLLACTIRIEHQVRDRLRREFETTLPRFDLMAQLERHPDGLRMSELSRRLMVSGGNVTGITDQLEREHLVVRMFDPADRRVVAVKLTAAGLARFRDMATCHEQWIIELLAGLDQTDKLGMFDLLQKLKAHVTTVAMTAPAPDSAGS